MANGAISVPFLRRRGRRRRRAGAANSRIVCHSGAPLPRRLTRFRRMPEHLRAKAHSHAPAVRHDGTQFTARASGICPPPPFRRLAETSDRMTGHVSLSMGNYTGGSLPRSDRTPDVASRANAMTHAPRGIIAATSSVERRARRPAQPERRLRGETWRATRAGHDDRVEGRRMPADDA